MKDYSISKFDEYEKSHKELEELKSGKGRNIIVSKSNYNFLFSDSEFLSALESHGVDNWDGYSSAWNDVYKEED